MAPAWISGLADWVSWKTRSSWSWGMSRARRSSGRAKASGYTGLVLADYKLNILDRVPGHYLRHAAKVRAAAATLSVSPKAE